MTVDTIVAAIVAVVFLYCFVNVHNAQAAVTGTLLLCYGWHGQSLLIGVFMIMREQVLDHNVEHRVHAGVCHRIEHLLSTPFRF